MDPDFQFRRPEWFIPNWCFYGTRPYETPHQEVPVPVNSTYH